MIKEKALKDSTPVSYRIVCSVLFSVFFFFLSLPQGLVSSAFNVILWVFLLVIFFSRITVYRIQLHHSSGLLI
ncbi:uncharacterized protein C8R40DRAFT_1133971, partial [Lentinula edodes]|uniref:uncharacterized protein n=1 Tax=Lentinula edodes TaxID=5353 RepID=UPI001E8CBDE0